MSSNHSEKNTYVQVSPYLSCLYCNFKSNINDEMNEHMNINHQEEYSNENQIIKTCKNCNYESNNTSYFKIHMMYRHFHEDKDEIDD